MGAPMRTLGVCSLAAVVATAVAVAGGSVRESARSSAPPGDPVVVSASGGAYAVAVPALSSVPVLAGDAVAFLIQDDARPRLFSIAMASASGESRTLYTAPRKRPGAASSLGASETRVVALRQHPDRFSPCGVDSECSPAPIEVLAGAASGPLTRLFRTTEHITSTGSCERRIVRLADSAVSVSGERVAYARRVRCLRPHRRSHAQVVVRDLRSSAVRVVHRGAARGVQLAGRYLAFERTARDADGPVVVRDLRSGRVAYRVDIRYLDYYSLGADGTLVQTIFRERCCSRMGRIGWYSPRSPRLHRLPNRVSAFSGAPLAYAAGRIAYVSRYDFAGDTTLSITDLAGRSTDHAHFAAPEALEAFAFDGARLAFAHTRFRPDQGAADDGLRSICVDDHILVQATASVIEVHPITNPGRIPASALPSAAPYRSANAERPECPYRD